MMFVLKWHKL